MRSTFAPLLVFYVVGCGSASSTTTDGGDLAMSAQELGATGELGTQDLSATPPGDSAIPTVDGGSPDLAMTTMGGTVIVMQPNAAGILQNPDAKANPNNGNFCIPPNKNSLFRQKPLDRLQIEMWTPPGNPNTATGLLVPTTWNMGSVTGFTPKSPATAQLAFDTNVGTSGVQAEGTSMGIYLDAADAYNPLPAASTNGNKMGAFVSYRWSNVPQGGNAQPTDQTPWADPKNIMTVDFDFWVRTATGKSVYSNFDFQFATGANMPDAGKRISFNVGTFSLGAATFNWAVDPDTQDLEFIFGLGVPQGGVDYATLSSADGYQSGPWTDKPKHISFSISYAQFAAMLQYGVKNPPNGQTDPSQNITDTNPSHWTMDTLHMNSEMTFNKTGSAGTNGDALGLSISNLVVRIHQ